ncbi:MAG: RDD family protein [Candidatus Acidiferrales bacterium]
MRCNHCGASLASELAFCGACKRPLVGYSVGGSSSVPAETVAALASAPTEAKFAGFWLRFLAALVDAIVLALALGVVASFTAVAKLQPLAFLKLSPTSAPSAVLNLYGHEALVRMLVFFVIASWLYFAFMESSSAQATLGKKLVGLYVTDADRQRPSFLRASGRFSTGRLLAHIPGIGILYFVADCICAGVTPKKQAVHDMITGCLVLRRPPRFEPES